MTGAKNKVIVGDNGEVVLYYCTIPSLEEYQEMDVISPEEALEQVKQEGIVSMVENPEKAEIKSAKLAYWVEPLLDADVEFVQPVYIFEGEATGGNKKNHFQTIIPAVKK